MATLEEEYQKNQTQGVDTTQLQGGSYDQINQMYDAQRQAQLAGLEQAYNQSRSDAQAARDELPGQYQARANDLAVQYERNKRNLNEQAAANGLNTGAGSQMQLALGSNFQRDYGGIRTAEQKAINEADRGLRDMEAAYQSSVQQAVADNDYKRAQALMAEYQNQYARQLQQAQTLASYGDFSAYLNIPGYSQQQVDAMRNSWIASNPDMAYRTGAISADQYRQMTGSYPAGYQRTGGGGGGNGGGGDGEVSGDINGDGVVDDTDKYLRILQAGANVNAGLRNSLDALLGRDGENGGNNKAPQGSGADIENAIYQVGASRNPQAELEALLNSPYYDQMTDDQRARLATAYQHATHTGNYAPPASAALTVPGIGQNGYYIDPALRTGPGVPRPKTQYDR